MESKFLVSLVLVVALCAGVWLGVENFGAAGQSAAQSENQQQIYNITFDNLPDEEKQKYISKEDLFEYGGYITPKSYTQNFSDYNDTSVSDDVEELQAQVRELSAKNKILAQDNVDMSEKNLEFIAKISQIQKQSDDAKNALIQENTDRINELEVQHLQNINELTKRLSEAQADMIESSKAYEQKIVDLENEINGDKGKKQDEAAAISAEFAKFKNEAEANLKAASEQNKELEAQILRKDEQIKNLISQQNQNDEIARNSVSGLQEELENRRKENQNLLVVHDREIAEIKSEFSAQKEALQKQIEEKQEAVARLETALENNKSALDLSNFELGEIKKNLNGVAAGDNPGRNLELNASLATLKKSFGDLKEKSAKSEAELKASLENARNLQKELDKSAAKISDLEKKNDGASAVIAELNAKLDASKNELKQKAQALNEQNVTTSKSAKILAEQNASITALEQKNAELGENLKKLTAQIEEKSLEVKNLENNLTALNKDLTQKQGELDKERRAAKVDSKNYEILRAQINVLEKKITEISTLHADSNATINKIDSLKDELESAKKTADESNKTIERLNLKIAQLTNQKGVSGQVNAKIAELEKDIEQNLNKQDKLEDENVNLKKILQAQTKSETPTKVVLISSITCEDMDAKDKISVMCKNRVSEFLQRFSSKYIYEIIPIVDKRNVVIPVNLAQSIKKDDLGRLNNYVNYGVGKERAKAAAELIKDEFGDFARISFSSEVIVKDDERGFTIKVYR